MPPDSVCRVVIAEEDFIAREGIRCIMDSLADVEVVGMAESHESLFSALVGLAPDAVLFGLQPLPTKSEAVAAALRLRTDHPEIGLIILTYEPGEREPLDLLSRGSAGFGYLLRQNLAEPGQLLEAINNVVKGGLVLDPEVVDAVLQSQRRRANSRLRGLTDREHEVLTLMATGQNNAAIAKSLVLSKPAVERHINSIFRKLGLSKEDDVSQRVKAVLFYLNEDQLRTQPGSDAP